MHDRTGVREPTATRPDAVHDVVVVGAGAIGLCSAWRAAQRGLRVAVVDPAPGTGASHAAAGMLAPATELHHGEEALLRLNLHAAQTYPAFVADLERATGQDVAYRACGTLAVGLDRGDLAEVDDLLALQHRLGLRAERLTGRECSRSEPLLATVAGGVLVPDDHQVDPRRLVAALLAAAARAGVTMVDAAVRQVHAGGAGHLAVHLDDGRRLEAGRVVVAAGARSGPSAGLRVVGPQGEGLPDVLPDVRPVKGQVLRMHVPASMRQLLTRTVRGTVRGRHVYLVPREDGEVVVGATSEEVGFDEHVTAGAVHDLLRDARLLVPALGEARLVETCARLRPGSADNAPYVGETSVPGLLVATGHHRGGILLAGVTGDAVASLLSTGTAPPQLEPFSPSRSRPHHVQQGAPAWT